MNEEGKIIDYECFEEMGYVSRKGERLRQNIIMNFEYLVGYYMEGEKILFL